MHRLRLRNVHSALATYRGFDQKVVDPNGPKQPEEYNIFLEHINIPEKIGHIIGYDIGIFNNLYNKYSFIANELLNPNNSIFITVELYREKLNKYKLFSNTYDCYEYIKFRETIEPQFDIENTQYDIVAIYRITLLND